MHTVVVFPFVPVTAICGYLRCLAPNSSSLITGILVFSGN